MGIRGKRVQVRMWSTLRHLFEHIECQSGEEKEKGNKEKETAQRDRRDRLQSKIK